MKKLLFFDIDGTLAYPRSIPTPETVSAIRRARRNGHKAFISTGRTVDSIPPAVAAIGFDGGIFSAGGIVVLEDTVLAQHFMSNQISQTVISLLTQKAALFTLETAEGRFNSEHGPVVLSKTDMSGVSEEMQRFTSEILLDPTTRPLSEYRGQPIFKIAYYCEDATITAQLTDELTNLAKVVQFDNIPGLPITIGEISDPSVNKASAMTDICHHFGMTHADCIAFGDSMNDAEILTAAGLGIAMGNAEPTLKELADTVCESCEDDGIAKSLHKLGLI